MLSIIDKNAPIPKVDPSQFTPAEERRELLKKSRDEELHEGRRRAIKGYALLFAGIFLPGCAQLLLIRLGVDFFSDSFFWIARAALLFRGSGTVYESRRLRTPTFDEVRELDSRRSILYVRSFDDDERSFDRVHNNEHLFKFLAIFWPPIAFRSKRRYEQVVATILRPVGPLVAIGRPGEGLPELGAARTYTTDAKWQDWVLAQHRECAMVLMQAGRSAGLLWEVERAFRRDTFKPTLVCFPPDKPNGRPPEELFQSFRTMLAAQDLTLPETLGKSYVMWFDRPDHGVLVKPGRKGLFGTQARLAPGFEGIWPLLEAQLPGVEFKALALAKRRRLLLTAAWVSSLLLIAYFCLALYYNFMSITGPDI